MHDHDHNCGCGHNHEHEPMITLTLDDDTELECIVMSIFPVGEKEYIALLAADSTDEEASEVYLYQYVEHDDDEVELINIEDDNEFEEVSQAFDALLDEEDDDYFDFDLFNDEDDIIEEDDDEDFFEDSSDDKDDN